MVRGIFGVDLNRNIALEAMIGAGVSDDSAYGAKLELKHAIGFYIKPKINLTDNLEAFARLGIAKAKLKVSSYYYGSVTDSDNDFSFGAGLAYTFSSGVYGALDYMRYYDKDGLTIDGATLSIGFRF